MNTRTWYATVGFGGNPAPKGPWDSPDKAAASVRRWVIREGFRAANLVNSHTIRINGYTTRQLAREGDISDSPGTNGCISIQGLNDFLANHNEEES